MKKLFVGLLLFCSFSVYGQKGINIDNYKVLDTSQLNVTYRMLRVHDLDDPADKYEDRQVLQIGGRLSKYYSQWYMDHVYYADSLRKANPMIDGIPGNPHKTYDYEIHKNYSERKITVINQARYIYEETIRFLWEIGMETEEIVGYKCQKATTSFRGRNYTVWFTKDIPISDGPWKFNGLPGLILKATDSEGHYDFECIGIEAPRKNGNIKMFNDKYEKISRTDLEKLDRRMHKDWAAFYSSSGILTLIQTPDGRWEKTVTTPPIPYNPIERE